MSVCDTCRDPGACCRDIILNFDPAVSTRLEALAWIATILPTRGEIGLPFLPIGNRRDTDADGAYNRWHWRCVFLTDEGRCGNYESRPNLCRTFRAGLDRPCAMNCPPLKNGAGDRPRIVEPEWVNGE